MKSLPTEDGVYVTKAKRLSFLGANFPSFFFYSRLIAEVFRCASMARRGVYDNEQWRASSLRILQSLEGSGVSAHVSGLQHICSRQNGPCVIIGNHMSFLETLLLPGLILPRPVTFVIKQSLLEYPVFKHVMRSREPIAVSRVNPRQDLKTVLEEGGKRLAAGISVIVFPQSTRSHTFVPASMGSIGVKLAKRAAVPVLPLALKTDALQNGRLVKDFGAILPRIPVHIAFAPPLVVAGKGSEEMAEINGFIEEKLREWTGEN
ncbi:MAG: lysophospholipid acyltransferase family protein [Desulfopila sp.]